MELNYEKKISSFSNLSVLFDTDGVHGNNNKRRRIKSGDKDTKNTDTDIVGHSGEFEAGQGKNNNSK